MWLNLSLAVMWFLLVFLNFSNIVDAYNKKQLTGGTAFRLTWTIIQVYFLIYNLNAFMTSTLVS